MKKKLKRRMKGRCETCSGGLLRREWPAGSGRASGTIFWCEVDRRDIRITYERVIQVVAAPGRCRRAGKCGPT